MNGTKCFFFFCLLVVLGVNEPSTSLADTTSVSLTVRFFECNDGVDNDGDGYVDYPDDVSCDAPTDDVEADVLTECADGIDNDGDKKTDFPADRGCDSADDDSENSQPEIRNAHSSGKGPVDIVVSGAPGSAGTVIILKDDKEEVRLSVDAGNSFSDTIKNLSAGPHKISVYFEREGEKRVLIEEYQVTVTENESSYYVQASPTSSGRDSSGGEIVDGDTNEMADSVTGLTDSVLSSEKIIINKLATEDSALVIEGYTEPFAKVRVHLIKDRGFVPQAASLLLAVLNIYSQQQLDNDFILSTTADEFGYFFITTRKSLNGKYKMDIEADTTEGLVKLSSQSVQFTDSAQVTQTKIQIDLLLWLGLVVSLILLGVWKFRYSIFRLI